MQYLRAQRQQAGLSQRELALRLGKPPSYVHKCEVGERQLNIYELRQWCRALQLSWLSVTGEIEVLWQQLDIQNQPEKPEE